MKKRIAFLIAAGIAAAAFGWQTTGKWRYRGALADRGRDADSVILERWHYGSDHVFQSATMSGGEFRSRMHDLPLKPGTMKISSLKCWIPHHRIRFVGGRDDSTVEICFTCGLILTKPQGVRILPDEWNRPIRELFLSQGIPDTATTPEEETQAVEEIANRAESPPPDPPDR